MCFKNKEDVRIETIEWLEDELYKTTLEQTAIQERNDEINQLILQEKNNQTKCFQLYNLHSPELYRLENELKKSNRKREEINLRIATIEKAKNPQHVLDNTKRYNKALSTLGVTAKKQSTILANITSEKRKEQISLNQTVQTQRLLDEVEEEEEEEEEDHVVVDENRLKFDEFLKRNNAIPNVIARDSEEMIPLKTITMRTPVKNTV